MAKGPENYGGLVERLESVVKQLETGELSLEDSLKAFEEGVGLVNRGEKMLTEAERRIEQLLEQGGGTDAPVPFDAATTDPTSSVSKVTARSKPPAVAEDDVPF